MSLRDLSVRTKLAAIFVSVSFLTFGVGGTLVAGDATDTLQDQIMARLEFQSRAYATGLDAYLLLLARRSEDFASDGFIRDETEFLTGAATLEESTAHRDALRRHLLQNKLPLELAFQDLTLIGTDGEVVLSTCDELPEGFGARVAGTTAGSEPWFSELLPGRGATDPARFAIVVPLTSRHDGHPLGSLVAWIGPGVWITSALGHEAFESEQERGETTLHLVDRTGARLRISGELIGPLAPRPGSETARSGYGLELIRDAARTSAPAESGPGRDTETKTYPIRTNGWDLRVELRYASALSEVAGLQGRFLGLGALLAGAACALFLLPMRLLMQPLLKLADAARRLEGGDLSTRVDLGTNDEFGELGRSFNSMATSIEDRTREQVRTARDLRKRQGELSYERDRLQGVISSMRDGLVVLDANGRTVVHNRAAGPLLSRLRTEGLPIVPHHLCDEAGAADAACHACLFDPDSGPKSCVVELDRGVFEVHAVRLAPDSNGRAGRLLVSHDLTDRIAQDERQIHQERLAVLGEVAAVMAHELNNPLAAISMYNQMLASELGSSSPLQENVQVIQRNVESCKRAIRELLDYATDTTPQVDAVDLHATLADVTAFLRPLRERAGVDMVLDLGDERLEVSGDEVQIRQIFVNLIVNAIQAIGDRGGTVTITSRTEDTHAVIRIADDGPGIPDEARDHIFRPFFTTKGRGSGTGLGLPTSLRIAEMYGGGLELIETGPGGSVFHVRLLLRGGRGS